MAIKRTLSHRRAPVLVALGAIVFVLAWATDRPLPSDELVNRPDGPIRCVCSAVAACEYRM
jgi:hypothetical protein